MLPTIAGLASKHGISPLKRYGQNFIFDETLCDKIVRASGIVAGDTVLEIGPGTAGLTRSILKMSPQILHVVETDSRCLPLLAEIKALYPNLNIYNQDALKFKLADIAPAEKLKIAANLPYNIGTLLVTDWLEQAECIASMTLMLQKEVVDRMVAVPGTKEYGRLSIICKLVCNVEKCFDVSPKAFYPPPKIWSSIVKLTPKAIVYDKRILKSVQKITALAFSQRRKMIHSSLKMLAPDINSLLEKLSIKSNLRSENLTPEDYLNLAIELMIQE